MVSLISWQVNWASCQRLKTWQLQELNHLTARTSWGRSAQLPRCKEKMWRKRQVPASSWWVQELGYHPCSKGWSTGSGAMNTSILLSYLQREGKSRQLPQALDGKVIVVQAEDLLWSRRVIVSAMQSMWQCWHYTNRKGCLSWWPTSPLSLKPARNSSGLLGWSTIKISAKMRQATPRWFGWRQIQA